MRLKRLTISGFKSFPKRTSITFSSGVSAIVGPNGSGKSNIVDAVRWVLGEQNPRLLRAKGMEDLIYKGNGAKAPASAYVRLVLENNAGMAPPELESLAEIEIERILFPNGDARFRLNRKNCRLKDIRYLFLDTGAGARAYSIIDQGQVGHFVSMSPEQRRLLVEEVAGISRYKARRAEASRRMAQTLQNLERLRDIITEVEKQARSLKRQSSKANRYLKLREEEEALSLFLLKQRWEEICSKEAELQKIQDAQKGEKEALEARLSAQDTWLKETDLRMEENRQEVKRLKGEIERIESDIEELSLGLMDREKALALCRQTQKSLREKLMDMNAQDKRAQKRREDERAKLSALKAKMAMTVKEKDRLLEMKQEREDILASLREELEEARDRMVNISAKGSGLRSRRNSLEDRLNGLRSRLSRIEKQNDVWERDLLALKQEKVQIRTALTDTKKLLAKWEADLSGLHEKRQETETAIRDLKRQRETLLPKITGLKAELNTLLRFRSAQNRLPQDLENLLRVCGTDARPLSDLVRVERGWENIVELALGESLKALLVTDPSGLSKIISNIKTGDYKTDVIAFLDQGQCMDSMSTNGRTSAEVLPQGLSPLSQRITGDDGGSEVARRILLSWFYADSIEDLLESTGDLKNHLACYVITADGFLVTPWAEIRYKGKEDKKDGTLWTRARIEEISPEISVMEERLQVLKKDMRQLENQYTDLLSAISRSKRELERIKGRRDHLLREKQAVEAKEDRTRDRLEVQGFEKDEVLTELHDIEQEISALDHRISHLEKQEKEAAHRLDSIQGSFEKAKQDKDKIEAELQQYSIEKARLDTEIKALLDEIRRIEAGLKKSKALMIDIETELRGLSERERSMVEEIEQIAQEKQAFVDKEALLLKSLKHEEDTLDRLMSERAEREGIKRQVLNRLSQASSGLHETEIELSRLSKEKEHLIEACWQDFAKDIKEKFTLPSLVQTLTLEQAEKMLLSVREKIDGIGPVNLTAIEEFEEIEKRRAFLMLQQEDLKTSLEDIKLAIGRIDRQCRQKFRQAMEEINESLKRVFPLLFDGGTARLNLDNPGNILDSGVEFFIEIPGKRIKNLNLLSGGEKALSALALIFAIFFIKPSPFCLLDEVDAPLDEANTIRFNRLIKKIAAKSQVILVTHSQRVMETADRLFGVTMEEKGVSKLVSVSLS